MDGRLFLAVSGRICPCCGLRGLIGNGYRLRTYRTEPVRRGRKAPEKTAVRARAAGASLARVSALLGGVSNERIAAWHRHVTDRLATARRSAEAILRRDPRFARPAALLGKDVFAYLQSLLGITPAIGVLVALNSLFSANPPLCEPLLVHPPTSSGRPNTPCRTAAAGGAGFG